MARILIAEDDPATAAMLSLLLTSHGHIVRTAANGAEALLAAHEDRPDLIFMDVVMPILDGLETIRALRSDAYTHEIPIVVLSVRADDRTLSEALALGANLYLTKPPDPAELLAVVERLTDLQYGQSDAR
jgi:CheY-like chemotaxis protein